MDHERIIYLANAYSILEEVVIIVVVPNTRQSSGKLISYISSRLDRRNVAGT